MRSPVMRIAAYCNIDDLKARRNSNIPARKGSLATHYLVDYHIPTLVEANRYSQKTSVHFDMLAGGNYPYTQPVCHVFQSEMPWLPHFKRKHPICVGELSGDAQGATLLGHLLIRIARLLNFDELVLTGGYLNHNAEAIQYWRSQLKEKPITPNLCYPVLPENLVPPICKPQPNILFGPARKQPAGPLSEFFSVKWSQGKASASSVFRAGRVKRSSR